MTLKKFLKKLSDYDKDYIELSVGKEGSGYVGHLTGKPCDKTIRKKYANYRVKMFYPYCYCDDRVHPQRLTIVLEEPTPKELIIHRTGESDSEWEEMIKEFSREPQMCESCEYKDSTHAPCTICKYNFRSQWKKRE